MDWVKEKYKCFECQWTCSSKQKKAFIFLMAYTVLFFAAFFLAYNPFLQSGKSFIWKNDGRSVHYPTLVYIGRYFRQIILNLMEGKFSVPLFDLCIGTGNDILSTLNNDGFGDPLNLLAIFTPTKYIECLYNFLVVFRLYLAGLTFSALCIYHRKRVSYALIGALLYVFSGYAIFCSVRHPFFISPMIQFPLLLIGIDRIIKKKSPVLFTVSVFYSAICGFYFLYMMTILLSIYTLIRFFDCYQIKRVKEFFHMAGRIAGSYFWGLGLSAVIFVPAIFGFYSSCRFEETITRNYLSWGWNYYRNNILRVIAPGSSWNSLGMAAIILLAVVLLLVAHEKKYRSLKIWLAAAAVIYTFPLGGYIMNGFGYPSQRWTFGVMLLVSYIVVDRLPILLNLNRKQSLICFGVLLAYAACVFIGSKNRSVNYVVGVAMLAVTLVVLLLFNNTASTFRSGKGYRAGAVACVLLVIGNVSINAVYRYAGDQGDYVNEFTKYGVETERLETAFEREAEPFLSKQDGRFDSRSFTYNANMVWHIPTMYIYQNLSNGNNTELWKATENIQQKDTLYRIMGADQRTIMNTLLSTKYVIEKEDQSQYLPYGYKMLQTTANGNHVYANKYALPWGYTYDSYTSYDTLEKSNGLEAEEAMLQAIALDETVESFSAASIESNIKEIPYTIQEMSKVEWTDGILKVEKAGASITLEFQLPAESEGYLRLRSLDINNSGQEDLDVTVECAGISKSAVADSTDNNWYYGRENYLFNLGYSAEKRTTCTIFFHGKGTFRLGDIQLYALPMDKYPEQVEALRAEPLENIKFGSNRISGSVNLSSNKILCMSIPYSAGWSAKVDGEPVKILRGNYLFMAVPLTEGRHEIEFVYCTPGLRLGLALSLLSFAGAAAWYRYSRKKAGKTEEE